MPFGFPPHQYVGLIVMSLASMLAGGVCMNAYLRPDLTIPEVVPPKPVGLLEKPEIRIVPPRGRSE
eukprot:m.126203 g.126203  ORF g.126203 m.126203 type:complete len:66 (+) comp16331_c1_seq2:114-311(+)